MPVTFELEHRVYHVLKDLGSCYASVFCYMTNKKNRCLCFFCKPLEFCCALSYLRNTSGRRVDEGGMECLYRVNNYKLRLQFFYLLENSLGRCFREHIKICIRSFKPVGTHL